MPNKCIHRPTSAVAGTLTALALSRKEEDLNQLLECLGGAMAGWLGGALPDWIDPPVSPRHRSVGHAVVPVGTAISVLVSKITSVQESMRWRAEELKAAASTTSSPWEWLLHALTSVLARIGAGAVAGLPAGYVLHLVLDASTPAGLPIFS